jgi:predicted RNase H-like nuclease (RuvC/YqgF family)
MPKQKKQDESIEESQQTLEKYRAEIEAMKEKASHYSTEVKAEFDKRLSELETLYGEAQKRYDSLKGKTEEAWEDTKDFVVLTNKALVHSYHYFISHYKKKG